MGSVDTLTLAHIASAKCKRVLTSPTLELSAIAERVSEHPDRLLDRLLALKPADMSKNAWAVKAGVSRSVWTDIRNRNSAEPATIEALLDVIGITKAQFDAGETVLAEVDGGVATGSYDVRETFFGGGRTKALPVLGTAIGGEYGEPDELVEMTELWYESVIEHVARPSHLLFDDTAYALTIVGESMVPRFRPSERVTVSPKSPISIGDDVIVQLRGPDGDDGERIRLVLIKELVKRTSAFVELRQYNPSMIFRVPVKELAAMHKVTSNFF